MKPSLLDIPLLFVRFEAPRYLVYPPLILNRKVVTMKKIIAEELERDYILLLTRLCEILTTYKFDMG